MCIFGVMVQLLKVKSNLTIAVTIAFDNTDSTCKYLFTTIGKPRRHRHTQISIQTTLLSHFLKHSSLLAHSFSPQPNSHLPTLLLLRTSQYPIYQLSSNSYIYFIYLFHHSPIITMGIKFIPAEDFEIIRLKEQVTDENGDALSWKSISNGFAAKFPGTSRKFNDLQVRYTRSLKLGERYRARALAHGATGMIIYLHTLSITSFSSVSKI
jgi:hypothetical protein